MKKNVIFEREFSQGSLFPLSSFKYHHMSSVALKVEKQPNRTKGIEKDKQLLKNQDSRLLFVRLLENERLYPVANRQLIKPLDANPDYVLVRDKVCIFFKAKDTKIDRSLKKAGWHAYWLADISSSKTAEDGAAEILNHLSSRKQTREGHKFTFVDLFAGVGGFRVGLERNGGKCLGFSEIDRPAISVYKSNFLGWEERDEVELGDITKLGKLPFKDIDLIVGGVPCQSWSVAGKMKGFDDPRGKLWMDTIRVVELNTPKAFIFENVKGLMDPRNRANLDLIETSFRKLGYAVQSKLLNSYDFGLPQNRDRIFIVGIRKNCLEGSLPFTFPLPIGKHATVSDILDGEPAKQEVRKKTFDPKEIFGDKIPLGRNRFQRNDELNDFFVFCDTRNGHSTIHSWDLAKTTKREKDICMVILRNRRKKIYGPQDGNPLSFAVLKSLLPDLKETELQRLVEKRILRYVPDRDGYEFVNSKNSAGINGIYRIYLPHSKVFSTLTATGTKDMVSLTPFQADSPEEYRENFINSIVKRGLYRPISAKEAGKLQGFPEGFAVHSDEALAKKQFGNAVSTSVIYYLGQSLLQTKLFDQDDRTRKSSHNR